VSSPRCCRPMRNWLHICHREKEKNVWSEGGDAREKIKKEVLVFFLIIISSSFGSCWSDIDRLTLVKYPTLHCGQMLIGCWGSVTGTRPVGSDTNQMMYHRSECLFFFCDWDETEARIVISGLSTLFVLRRRLFMDAKSWCCRFKTVLFGFGSCIVKGIAVKKRSLHIFFLPFPAVRICSSLNWTFSEVAHEIGCAVRLRFVSGGAWPTKTPLKWGGTAREFHRQQHMDPKWFPV